MSFNSWVKYNLLDISKIHTGKSNSVDSTEYGPYPFIDRSQTIKRSLKYLYDETAILIPGEGQEFNPRYISGKYDLHQRVYAIVPDEKIVNAKFLYYLMIDNKNVLSQVAVGSTVKSLRLSSFEFLKLHIPKLSIQEEITNILSSLDDKIELNNKINKNLEELAQTLYKHWFVDFEFPNEEGKPYKSSGGKMIESELGPIPYGWEVKEQGEYFPIITGKKNANYSTDDGEFNFFTCSQQIFKAPGYSFEGSAILVAGNGDFNVKYYKGKFEAYQRTYVLIPHNEKLSGLLYFLIKENLSEITSGHRGSVIKFITKGDLEKYKIIMPKDIQLLEQMSRQFQNIVNKIQHNNEENTKLAEMRDLLLPKLMSGEIRMPVEE